MLETTTGEIEKTTLKHEGNIVREFYSHLPRPVRVGIEATGSMQWFVNLIEELGIECLVGHPAEIRAAEPRKQKHDRRDADSLLSLLVEERFPTIWLPTKELLDIRALSFCFFIAVVQFSFPTLAGLFYQKRNLLKARVVIYAK